MVGRSEAISRLLSATGSSSYLQLLNGGCIAACDILTLVQVNQLQCNKAYVLHVAMLGSFIESKLDSHR